MLIPTFSRSLCCALLLAAGLAGGCGQEPLPPSPQLPPAVLSREQIISEMDGLRKNKRIPDQAKQDALKSYQSQLDALDKKPSGK